MRFLEPHSVKIPMLVILFLGGLVLGNCASSMGRASSPSRTQRALALAVARVAVNEASLIDIEPADVRLVYEATRYHAERDRERLAWLRRHSRCASGGDCNRDGRVDWRDELAAMRRPGNAAWARQLGWHEHRPALLARSVWRPRRWAHVRELALRLVLDNRPTDVCGQPIRSWGRRSDFDRRGGSLVPVECNGARNLGAVTPSMLARHRAALHGGS